MERKSKDIHYKRASLTNAAGTLQGVLEEVLDQLPLSGNRLELLGPNSDEGRVLLHPRHHKGMLCLTMSSYVKGALQPIMGITPKQKDWPIRQVQPPDIVGATETEFLDGYLYFGVWKNHLVILPTRSCGIEGLEDHLNWLARKHPRWPEKAFISLNDRSPAEYRDRSFKHVQAFKLDVPLQTRTVGLPAHEPKPETIRTESVNIKPSGDTWEGIKNFIKQFGGRLPEDLILDGTFDPNDVHVRMEVTCQKRGLDRSGPLLDVLANSLRHVTTDIVKIKFDDGTELKGSDLKTQKKIRIDCAGNMPVPHQVDATAYEYLQELIQRGIVQ